MAGVSASPREVYTLSPGLGSGQAAAADQPTPDRQQHRPGYERRVVGLLVVYAVAVRLLVGAQLPAWQGPDEPKHFEYVRTLIDLRAQLWSEHRLLRIADAEAPLEQQIIVSMASNHFWAFVGQPTPRLLPRTFLELWKGKGTQLHRPSLYYFAAALTVAPLLDASLEQQLLAVRALSAALGGVTVLLAYAAGRAARREDAFVGIVSAAFVAALPMNAFLGGNANVDNLATLVGGIVALGLARGLTTGWRRGEWLLVLGGSVLGLATKREFVGVLPAVVIVSLVWSAFNLRRVWKPMLVIGIAGAAGSVAVGVFSRAFVHLTTSASDYALNEPDQLARLLHPPLSIRQLETLLTIQWNAFFPSFWGMFGWFTVPLSPTVNTLVSVASLLGLAGVIVALVTCRRGARRQLFGLIGVYGLMILTMTALAFGVALSYFSASEVPQGRHIFGVLVPIAVVFAVGVRAWLPARWLGTLAPALMIVALLVLLDIAAYTQSFVPYFLERSFS